jgi:hypothetical protein
MEQFPTIRNMSIIGYGHPLMTRDVIRASLPVEDMFGVSSCQKINVPIDADGNITWFDSLGNPLITPGGAYIPGIGGTAGIIVDLTGKDFNSLNVTWDGTNYTTISVQPGFVLRFLETGLTPDPDARDFLIIKVEEALIAPYGPIAKIIRVNEPFYDVALTAYNYKLLGNVGLNTFHVGGKVDVALDDLAAEELDVIVSYAPEIDPVNSNIIEIPLVDYQVSILANEVMFEGNTPFLTPVLQVLKVAQVSPGASTNEEKVLLPIRDYTVVRGEHRKKYTDKDYDVLRIHATEVVGGVTLNPYIGQRLKITYLANPAFKTVQEFVDNPENKTVDIRIVPPRYVMFDVNVTYHGGLSSDVAVQLIRDYIRSLTFGQGVSVSDITELLLISGASSINYPVVLHGTRLLDNGVSEDLISENKLTIEDGETMYPVTTFSGVTNEDE